MEQDGPEIPPAARGRLGARGVAALIASLLGAFWLHAEWKRARVHSEPVPAAAVRPRTAAEVAAAESDGRARAEASGMLWVPGGEFFMGCNEAVDDECDAGEKPGHTAQIGGFAIDATEVTVSQYRACVDAGGCSAEGLTSAFWGESEKPRWTPYCNWTKPDRRNHPINCVSWEQAGAYCAWAKKRLPVEMEWEKAARGTDGRKYPWGNTGYEPGTRVANIADETSKSLHPEWNFPHGYDDGYFDTAPVGSFPAGKSVYGALDMIGNVWEFVADDPVGGNLMRGGSWNNVARGARASDERLLDRGARSAFTGFRCVR